MIELCQSEVDAVSVGHAYTTNEVGGVMSSLASQWQPQDFNKTPYDRSAERISRGRTCITDFARRFFKSLTHIFIASVNDVSRVFGEGFAPWIVKCQT